jgi:hypothetical protein
MIKYKEIIMSGFSIDPQTAQILQAVIANLISSLSVYVTYKVGMKQAEQNNTLPPVIDASKIEEGEKALSVVQPAVELYGSDDEKIAFTGFQQNPILFSSAMEQSLNSLAHRLPMFAQELQRLVSEMGNELDRAKGTVNVSGGTINGVVSGVNSGTITYNSGSNLDHT